MKIGSKGKVHQIPQNPVLVQSKPRTNWKAKYAALEIELELLQEKPSKSSIPPGVRRSLEVILKETIKRYGKFGYTGYLGHAESVNEWMKNT
jgi:hypothetical protein